MEMIRLKPIFANWLKQSSTKCVTDRLTIRRFPWRWIAVFQLIALAHFAAESDVATQPVPAEELQARLERGKDLYARNCFVCHGVSGQGVPGIYPPLSKSDLIVSNLERAIRAVVEGISGPLVVLGKKYNGAMPPVAINDD